MSTRLPDATIPAGYSVRRPDADELPAIAAFLEVCDRHDTGGADFTLAELESEWSMPRFERTSDAWLVQAAGGGLAAYAHLTRRPNVAPDVAAWVHPDHRGRGLGTALVTLTEDRVRELAATGAAPRSIVSWTNHPARDAAELLEAHGYRVSRRFWRMSIALGDEPPEAPRWPDDVELRPMRPGVDDEAVYDTVVTAFRDHWNASPLPFEEWRTVRMGARSFDPSLWLLAWSGDRLVGASLDADADGEAWVQTLGVLREARGKGVGRALLLESFREFHRRGHRKVSLGVDAENPTGATRLYEGAGMRVELQYDHWERDLEA